MSKKLVLCVVLALSLVLVGTGYAYWTDTLNVTTKATTGDLDVTFVDLGAYAQYSNETGTNQWGIIDGIGADGYVKSNFFGLDANDYNKVFGSEGAQKYYTYANNYNRIEMKAELKDPGTALGNQGNDLAPIPYGSTTVYGDTISLELYNMYPGYAQAFRSDIINIGSIAAKLSKVDFNLLSASNNEIRDLIGVALLVEDENYNGGPEYGKMVKLASNFAPDNKFTLGGVEFVRLSALQDLDNEILADLLLLPETNPSSQHRADLFIGVAIDPDASGVYTTGKVSSMKANNDALTQNQNITLDIVFGWDQFNVDNNPNVTNRLNLQNGTPAPVAP